MSGIAVFVLAMVLAVDGIVIVCVLLKIAEVLQDLVDARENGEVPAVDKEQT